MHDPPPSLPHSPPSYLATRLQTSLLPALRRLLERCRALGHEVIYTCIESETVDGRDRSLDYKLSGIHGTSSSPPSSPPSCPPSPTIPTHDAVIWKQAPRDVMDTKPFSSLPPSLPSSQRPPSRQGAS